MSTFVALVVDVSGTMTGDLDAAKCALADFARSASSGTSFGHVLLGPPGACSSEQHNTVDSLQAAIKRIQTWNDGGNYIAALSAALQGVKASMAAYKKICLVTNAKVDKGTQSLHSVLFYIRFTRQH